MPLPWWEFNPADFSSPGSVAQPDHDSDEALLRGFLRAGALAETAACFLSGTYSILVPQVYDTCCCCWSYSTTIGQCYHQRVVLYSQQIRMIRPTSSRYEYE